MTQNIPQQTKFIMVILALFMPAFFILPLVIWGGGSTPPAINKNLQAARLAPVGVLTVGAITTADDSGLAGAAGAPAAFDTRAEYDKICAACHGSGLLNAPKLGDTAAWQAHLDKAGGLDALVKSGIQGIGGMPAKGGSAISDEQFHDMVVFMLDKAGVAH
ncbi:c-type cytochrome [uncultured Cardiobacterium sp.]|uniref:c-type cytochrome n=1 Tax=uncultured Cardiobacterium sp. TaxID=417619 RepID=UPI002605A0EB|nr:c-type cytochrome [uncultured Cardiobacterium sp.]